MKKRDNQASKPVRLDRRSFLKLLISGALSSFVPPYLTTLQLEEALWPELEAISLPAIIQEILSLVPSSTLREDGILTLGFSKGHQEAVPLIPTDWNLENSHSYNRLNTGVPWGIVIHWFGDQANGQKSVDFYLRGFNGKRQIGEYYTATSAHFLVGDHAPVRGERESLGIVQCQKPAPDGTPYQAAHIRTLDHGAHLNGQQYFVAALKKLNRKYPGVSAVLQDFYAVPGVLAHMQTLAVEITGSDFDDPKNYPKPQKIANVIAVVQACMKRYQIPAINLLGHFEIQLSKPDPGKKFLALIKYLIGVKALVDPDQDLKQLVFGPFLDATGTHAEAVVAYFRFLREYLLLTTSPKHIYEWDAWSKYLIFYDILTQGEPQPNGCHTYHAPLREPTWQHGFTYLDPDNHDGIDIYPAPHQTGGTQQARAVHLLADGTCVHLGRSTGLHDGLLAVFRHRQSDGSEIITSYGHLDEFTNIQVGERYPGGQIIGKINTIHSAPHGFLHFSVAYGPAWETHLQLNANTPLNAGPSWIQNHFMDPIHFLAASNAEEEIGLRNTHFIPK